MAIEVEVTAGPSIILDVQATVGDGESGGGGGVTDHGALTGLADDDHTQYALADGSRGAFAASGHNHSGTYDPAGTAASAVSSHDADTSVHGIADTSALATTSGVSTAVSDHAGAADPHGDRSYADSAVSTHSSDTTSVHGITDTANLVLTNDSRLSDARTPTTHSHTGTEVTVDASGFNGNLTTTDDTVQEVAQKLDDLTIPTAYTDEMARDAIGTALTAGTGIVKTVDDGADTITLASIQRQVHISGQYNCTGQRREGATSLNVSRLLYVPFVVSATTTFDRIAVNHEATVASASSVGRLGIYSHGASGPDSLIIEAGTIALDTAAAFKSVTISQQLTPGLYWLAFVPQFTGSSPTFTHGLPYVNVPSSDQTQGTKFQNSVTGALPSTATPGAANATGVVNIYMRAA